MMRFTNRFTVKCNYSELINLTLRGGVDKAFLLTSYELTLLLRICEYCTGRVFWATPDAEEDVTDVLAA